MTMTNSTFARDVLLVWPHCEGIVRLDVTAPGACIPCARVSL